MSSYFKKMRSYAERGGLPWFILSAEHGLVRPDDWLEPYDCYLPHMSRAYREDWGRRVAVQLAEALGSLDGVVIDLHAGAEYSSSLRQGLQGHGVQIIDRLSGLKFGQRLAWYDANPEPPVARRPPSLAQLVEQLGVASAVDVSTWLSKRDERQSPGLYTWWVGPLLTSAPAMRLGVRAWSRARG